jgi:hypothetical protein
VKLNVVLAAGDVAELQQQAGNVLLRLQKGGEGIPLKKLLIALDRSGSMGEPSIGYTNTAARYLWVRPFLKKVMEGVPANLTKEGREQGGKEPAVIHSLCSGETFNPNDVRTGGSCETGINSVINGFIEKGLIDSKTAVLIITDEKNDGVVRRTQMTIDGKLVYMVLISCTSFSAFVTNKQQAKVNSRYSRNRGRGAFSSGAAPIASFERARPLDKEWFAKMNKLAPEPRPGNLEGDTANVEELGGVLPDELAQLFLASLTKEMANAGQSTSVYNPTNSDLLVRVLDQAMPVKAGETILVRGDLVGMLSQGAESGVVQAYVRTEKA